MKKLTLSLVLCAGIQSLFAQDTLSVSNRILSQEAEHSGTQVLYTPVSPTAIGDTTTTDSTGLYSVQVAIGTYDISYVRAGYITKTMEDQLITSSVSGEDMDTISLTPIPTGLYLNDGDTLGDASGYANIYFKGNIYITEDGAQLDSNVTIEGDSSFCKLSVIVSDDLAFKHLTLRNSELNFESDNPDMLDQLDIDSCSLDSVKMRVYFPGTLSISQSQLEGVYILGYGNTNAVIDHCTAFESDAEFFKATSFTLSNNDLEKVSFRFVSDSDLATLHAFNNIIKSSSSARGYIFQSNTTYDGEVYNNVFIENQLIFDFSSVENESYVMNFFNNTYYRTNEIGDMPSPGTWNIHNNVFQVNGHWEHVVDFGDNSPMEEGLVLNIESNAFDKSEPCIKGSNKPSGLEQHVYYDAKGNSRDAYNNMIVDVDFTNPENDDFTLGVMSKVIDAGDADFLPAEVTTDIDGNDRVIDGDSDSTATLDMGAYEMPEGHYDGPLSSILDDVKRVHNYSNTLVDNVLVFQQPLNSSLEIYDVLGNLIHVYQAQGQSVIPMGDYANGIYLCKLPNEVGQPSWKILKR